MTMRRFILELGAGTDLHGGDYTKAAKRAIDDAIRHSSLGFARALGRDPQSMQVKVTIGVQEPEQVDADALARGLAHGPISVAVTHGGLDVPDEATGDKAVIASAAVEVWMDV
ncbi:MAG: hypothetical protein GKR94_24195 [Gammaproteobacteria bacterium]|nr:hypothetical protein [Gammaproteobacteria bacterium]